MKILPLYLLAGLVWGQTQVDLRNQGRNVDFSGAISTRPEKTGTVLPGTCNAGELFFNTAAVIGSNLYGCVAANTWAVLSGGSGGAGGPGFCLALNTSAPNTLSCTISGFLLGTGSMVSLFVTAPTTSSTVTLAINGGTATVILRGSGNAPAAGEVSPGATPVLISYNGSAFQIVDDTFEAGGSSCLAFSRTAFPWTIDINTSCVPELTGANAWNGYNNFSAAQFRLPESTVASLPTAASNTGKEFIVTDGMTSSDCATGGGTTVVNMCRSNGTSWVAIGAGTGGSSSPTLKSLFAFFGFGDSFIVGTGATSPLTQGAFSRLAQVTPNTPAYNYAQAGTSADAINFLVFSYFAPSPTQSSVILLDGGANDGGTCLTTACVNSYKELMMSTEAWLTIPFSFRQMASTATQTGTWAADTSYAINNTYTASPGTPMSASASGATLTFNIPTSASTKVGLTFEVADAQTGTFTVSVDGSLVSDQCSGTTTFSSGPCGNGGNLLQRPESSYRQEFPVTAGATHTVVITTTNATKVNVLCVDWIPPASTAAMNAVFVAGPDAFFAGSSTLDAASLAVATQLKADGLPVFFVDLINGTPGVNATTDIATTATATCDASTFAGHPNSECGYFHFAQTVYNVELASGFVFSLAPTPGPLFAGNVALPAVSALVGLCNVGQVAQYTSASPSAQLYLCTSPGTWTLQGGTSTPDAFSAGVGHWEPWGSANNGSSTSMTANTVYGVELPPAPLATLNQVAMAVNGSGHFILTLWNAAGTTQLASSTVTSMVSGAFISVNFPAFQLQANTTYLLTITDDHTADAVYPTNTDNASMLNAGTVPRVFTCANAASWSSGVPTLPSLCGARTAWATAPFTLMFFHQ